MQSHVCVWHLACLNSWVELLFYFAFLPLFKAPTWPPLKANFCLPSKSILRNAQAHPRLWSSISWYLYTMKGRSATPLVPLHGFDWSFAASASSGHRHECNAPYVHMCAP
mmetsp:Transcript_87227/g.145510  ORF Transcript_87227/g.145510 Transcript_87227/m.145510 type:complete len:110 (+) Transcript_87227:386-715(+)